MCGGLDRTRSLEVRDADYLSAQDYTVVWFADAVRDCKHDMDDDDA